MKSKLFWVLCCGLVLNCTAIADIVIEDGLVHDINYTVTETVDVYDDAAVPGKASVVNVSDGAVFETHVQFWDNCQLNMNGGAFEASLDLIDSATASISGGSINGIIFAGDDTTLTMSGNAQVNRCITLGCSTIVIEGNAVISAFESIEAPDITIRGGTISNITGFGFPDLDISGGVFKENIMLTSYSASITGGTFEDEFWVGGNIEISGGKFKDALFAASVSSLTFIGSGFTIDGQPIEMGTILDEHDLTATVVDGMEYYTCVLTGVLADGSVIDQPIYFADGTVFNQENIYELILIPEPASISLMLAGGIWGMRKSVLRRINNG